MSQTKTYPTYWQQWVGKFAICRGSDFFPPKVVYIHKIAKHGDLIGHEPNTNVLFNGSPAQLIEFQPRLFERLTWLWRYRETKRKLDYFDSRLRTGRRP